MDERTERSAEIVWSPATVTSTMRTGMRTGERDMQEAAAQGVPTVRSVMTTEVYAVAADTSLETAARIMAARHIGGMPVVRDRTPIGVVSAADLVDPDRAQSSEDGYPMYYRLTGAGMPVQMGSNVQVSEGRVADVMSPFVLSIEASASLVQATNFMLGEGVHRLLVREGTELVGIVTSTDLLRGFSRLFTGAERPVETRATR